MELHERLEKLLWSIALPGFGQLLNGKYVKGIVFIGLEFVVNMKSHLNEVILLSFQGDIPSAILHTDYQWIMFYPCLYMFAMWDAVKDAGGGSTPYSTLPYVCAAFLATVGLMYSDRCVILGFLMGPVWLAMLLCFIGITIGVTLQVTINRKSRA
ncbi:hypothetical protein [Paenibacillus hexagrammi]|uniref:Uncharacterized protein n=1 Tax=Paenibacillus hexagrammi TaxID=2908839 RepID=A0ABY3SME0_9BACL|nr:hypothetical protein [Paenibacillus sp. YPD9-1]UJF34285.1 hypothetical protein L0M14_03465 [Paenibacillus sp. YPD9-1]